MTLHHTTAPDGTEYLLTTWPDGSIQLATRPNQWSTWSPPIPLDEVPAEVTA